MLPSIPEEEVIPNPVIEKIVAKFLEEFGDIISQGPIDIGNTKTVQFKVETTYEVPVTMNYIPKRSSEERKWIKE